MGERQPQVVVHEGGVWPQAKRAPVMRNGFLGSSQLIEGDAEMLLREPVVPCHVDRVPAQRDVAPPESELPPAGRHARNDQENRYASEQRPSQRPTRRE